jgi:hypothetical protein
LEMTGCPSRAAVRSGCSTILGVLAAIGGENIGMC